MKRSINQLATNCERTSVANANENRQLQEKLASEQAKVNELAERLRTFTAKGRLQDKIFGSIRGTLDPSRHSDLLRCN